MTSLNVSQFLTTMHGDKKSMCLIRLDGKYNRIFKNTAKSTVSQKSVDKTMVCNYSACFSRTFTLERGYIIALNNAFNSAVNIK